MRHRQLSRLLPFTGLAAGVAATLGADLAHGLGHGAIGALVSVWPAVAAILI